MAAWKDIQSKVKTKKKTKLALVVLGLVVGLLIFSWAIRFTQNLFSPLGKTTSSRSYTWNGEFNVNLLVRAAHTSVLAYSPKDKKMTVINIPDETFVNVPRGFGGWQLRAVFELGGDSLLQETLVSFLGIPIDGFLDFTSFKPQTAIQIVNTVRENPFSGFNLLSYLKTNLTMWEILRLKQSLGSVRFDKIEEISLDKLNLLDQEKLPDGTLVFTADPVRLDSTLGLADPTIVSEHKSIAIFNATDRPQLAEKWARLVTNLGGNVIITGNAEERLKKTQIIGQKSATLKRLRQIFGLSDKISTGESAGSPRTEISLFLGEDL